MKTNLLLAVLITFVSYSCQQDIEVEDNSFFDLDLFERSNFDERVFNLIGDTIIQQFSENQNVYLIDLGECAKCSFGRIDLFFESLHENEEHIVITNDSTLLEYEISKSKRIIWFYIPNEKWIENFISSSDVLRYKYQNGTLVRL
jgi:hypothetical protein